MDVTSEGIIMGLQKKHSGKDSGNPNPSNWQLIKEHQEGVCLIAEVIYPDCLNFEGHKILVYITHLMSVDQIADHNNGCIEPHFSEDASMITPIARFEPTPKGRRLATLMARHYEPIDG
jgi:hypothetical protein